MAKGTFERITDEAGCDWLRLAPRAEDWNEALRATTMLLRTGLIMKPICR